MKKHLLMLMGASAVAGFSYGQVALTKVLPPAGAKLTIYQAASTTLARPTSGENQVWDYSAVSPSLQFSLDVKELSSVAQKYQDSCPTAKYVEVLNIPGAPTPDYLPMEFFEDKGDYMVRVGQKGSNLNLEKKNDTLFVFNLAFGASEVYAGSVREYSGYGTLKIGSDQYENVVMIRSKNILNASSDTGYNFFQITPYWTRLASVMFANGQSVGMSYWKPSMSTPTGINQTQSNLTIKLYPNPASSQLRIDGCEGLLTIMDMQGKVMYQNMYSSNQLIDINNLTNGIYFVKIESEGQLLTKKFVKQ